MLADFSDNGKRVSNPLSPKSARQHAHTTERPASLPDRCIISSELTTPR
jgi:hypothetical protein